MAGSSQDKMALSVSLDATEFNKGIDDMDKKLQDVKKTLDSFGKTNQTGFNAMGSGIEAINPLLSEVITDLKTTNTEVKNIATSFGYSITQIQSLVTKIGEMKNVAKTTGETIQKDMTVSAAKMLPESTINEMRTKLAELEKARRNVYAPDNQVLGLQNKFALQEIDRLKAKLKELDTSEEQLEKQRQKNNQEQLKRNQKEIDGINRMIAAAQKSINTSYSGSIKTAENAGSINQRTEAIKNLQAARASLLTTDEKYTQKLQTLNSQIARLDRENKQATASTDRLNERKRNLMDTAAQLERRLALVFSVSAITGYFNKLVETRGEMELQLRSLESIIQSKQKANELFAQVTDLAVKSPFQLTELISYTKQLAAYRVETGKLFETTKMLADVSAGLGVDMQRLILAYGQVKAANYLRGQELRQFSEAGINILGELAEQFKLVEGRTISVGEVFERVSKRMVSFSDVEDVFKKLTSQGGIFYNMQEIQAKTLKGQVSNLRDSVSIMMNEIGMANDGVLKGFVGLIRSAVENWRVLAEVLKVVAIGYGTIKVQQLLVKNGMLSEYYTLKMIAIEENKQLSAKLRKEMVSSGITQKRVIEIQKEIVSLKQLSYAQYQNILSSTQLSQSQLQTMVAINAKNSTLRSAIINLKLLTLEQVNAASSTNMLVRGFNVMRFGAMSMGTAFKAATASAIAFTTSMLPLLAFTAIFYGVTKLISSIQGQNEKMEENTKTYNDFRATVNDIEFAFNRATIAAKNFNKTSGDKNPIIEQREQFQKLIAELNDFGFNIDIKAENLDSGELVNKFKELRTQLYETIALTESANKIFLELDSIWSNSDELGDNIAKDFKDFNESFSELGNLELTLNKFAIAFDKIKNSFTTPQKALLEQFNAGKLDGETQEAYLLRRLKLYEQIFKIVVKTQNAREIIGKEEYNEFIEFGSKRLQFLKDEAEAIKNTDRLIKEYLKVNFITDVKKLTQEKKLLLNVGFDRMLIKQEVSGVALELAKQRFLAKIEFVVPPFVDGNKNIFDGWRKQLKDFQDLKKINVIDDAFIGDTSKQFSDLVSDLTSQYQSLNSQLKNLGDSQSDAAKTERKRIKEEIENTKNVAKLFDIDLKTKDKGKDLLLERIKDQISAIKEAQKAYEEYLKYFSRDESIKKVKEDYRNVFKGVGLKIDDIISFDQSSNIKLLESLKTGLKGDSLKELEKTIAALKAEVNVKLNVQDIDKFKKDIQDEIDRYELTVEITKLGFDPQLINSLFGEASVTLDQLKEFYEDKAGDIGLSQSFKQLLKLSSEEQLKLVDAGNQLRLEEVIKLAKKIEDIERKSLETRLNDYSRIIKEYQSYEDQISSIRKKALIDRKNAEADLASTPEQKAIVIQAIDKKEAQDVSSVLFNVIKNTELWAVTFENLEKAGDSALQLLYDQLKKYSEGAGKNLELTQFKELQKLLEKLEDQMKKRNPFNTIKVSLAGYSNAMELVKDRQSVLTSAQLRYNSAVENFGEQSPEAISALKILSSATQEYAEAENDAQKNAFYFNQAVSQLVSSVKGVGGAAKTTAQGVYDLAKALGYMSEESDTAYESTMNLIESQFQALDGVAQIIGGAYKKDAGMVIAGIGSAAQGTWNSIMSAIELWGRDSEFQKVIVDVTDDLEQLQKTFSSLEDVTFDSTNIKDFQRNFDALQANIKAQYIAIDKMRDAEKLKKNEDKDAIAQYTEDLEELAKREKELREERYAEAGIFELKSAIQDIANAWYEAYYAGEDTLNAITSKVKEFVRTYIKQMMLMQGADAILANVRNAMIGFLENDNFLDAAEMEELNRLVGVASEDLNNFFQSLSSGIGLFAENSNLSELQKGISAITESTAEALEALLNSIRLRMFEHYGIMESRATDIVLKLEQSNSIASQILAETSIIRQTLQQMRLWQDSITSPSHFSGGASIKVKAEMVG